MHVLGLPVPARRGEERVARYSLGRRQRLGVARSLLADPELLILDEPVNGLDPGGILEFRAMVRGLVGEGRTVVLSSHLLDEVEKVADAVAIVDYGRIVAQGSIEEITRADATTVLLGVAELDRTLDVVRPHRAVVDAVAVPDGVRLTLAHDIDVDHAIADINRRHGSSAPSCSSCDIGAGSSCSRQCSRSPRWRSSMGSAPSCTPRIPRATVPQGAS